MSGGIYIYRASTYYVNIVLGQMSTMPVATVQDLMMSAPASGTSTVATQKTKLTTQAGGSSLRSLDGQTARQSARSSPIFSTGWR